MKPAPNTPTTTNLLKNLFSNAVTQIAMFTVICCMVAMAVCARSGAPVWGNVYMVMLYVEAVVFIGWLVWATIMLMRRRNLTALNPTSTKIIDTVSLAMLFYWFVATWIAGTTSPIVVPVTAVIYAATLLLAWLKAKKQQ